MLVLTRRVGEEIRIGNAVHVRVVALNGQRVRLGITAPACIRVAREELLENRFAGDCQQARPEPATVETACGQHGRTP
jgi:carbon storage regulator